MRKSDNPFAIVILTALLALQKGNIAHDELLTLKKQLFKDLLQKQIPGNKIRAILCFIQYYVNFDNPEMNVYFDLEINLLTNKNATMGIEQFLAQRFRKEGMEIKETEKNFTFVKSLLTLHRSPSGKLIFLLKE